MTHLHALAAIAFYLIAGLPGTALGQEEPAANPYHVERSFPPYLIEHRKLFTEKSGIYKAGPHPVWTVHAPGGWIGNVTFIEGDDGLIVYDVCVSKEGAAIALEEIRKITDKPVVAIFYSHHHGDHYGGADVFVSREDVESGKVPIYAWDNFESERANEFGVIANRQVMGIAYYSGALLPEEEQPYLSCCGPKTLGGTSGYIPPTKTFGEDTDLEIAGVKMRVFYTGGEAISEFAIHLPEFDMVIVADEFFYALANLHSIRGSKPRVPENYIKALDKVRDIQPEWLLGSHIMPMQGKENILQAVTISRDAIQYLWDQSVRYINKGYTPVELQHKFKELPDYLDMAPYTRPMYGTPWIATPEFYTGWVSWFSGDATDLLPTEPAQKARRYVGLMGGRDKVLAEAEAAFANDDPQFAAELTQMLVRIDRNDTQARMLKAASLRKRGYAEINPIARFWYLTGALELEGRFDPRALLKMAQKTLVPGDLPAAEILESWRYVVEAETARDTYFALGFEITETGEKLGLELRNSILEFHESKIPANATSVVKLSTAELNQVSRGEKAFRDVAEIDGDTEIPDRLLNFLDRELPAIYMHD
ncbi:MAG: MBL fold metallo-hydrolase [Xanthomonadales bacterium]|nr:MBL fold metallo-hydrolase [Xanthomonadales bacterium]